MAGSTTQSPGPRRLAVYNDAVTLEDLARGRTRLALIRDMALGELSDRELALRIGCELNIVKAFRAVYAEEIAETVGALAGALAMETAGLWISKKASRMAEVQSDIEIINAAMKLLQIDENGNLDPFMISSREHDRLLRAKHFALAQAGHEYAESEKRISDQERPPTRYVIEMDDEVREALS